MKVFLVINDKAYEPTDILWAYADRRMAERKVAKMNACLGAYNKRQRKLEEEGQGREFEELPPHHYHALRVLRMRVIPSNRKGGFA